MIATVYVVFEAYTGGFAEVCAVFKTEEEAEKYIEWRQTDETATFYFESAPLF